MDILILIIIASGFLLAGYFLYGRFLRKLLNLSATAKTPAHTLRDDVDFVPTAKVYLLGQHFSAIAAAGPIVGPVLAGIWFGWVPTILWIVLGGIFIGGVHDLVALVASVKHEGKSIAEVIKANISRHAFILFLFFLWFSIIYIITTFTDITAGTFIEPIRGPGVASSSMMYLGLALVMGITLKIFKMPLFVSTLIFLPLVFLCIYLGPVFPLSIPPLLGGDLRITWDILLLIYCFFASVIPVWLVLQPRGYLGGFFLTCTVLVSFIGIIVGSFTQNYLIHYPAFTKWVNPAGLPLLPVLFTTVACGACSGFHALVSSGTTSKQISKETDAMAIGYGGMLLESFVAIIALATLLLLTSSQAQKLGDPNQIYANGIASFLSALGINRELALNFALLAFATFVYDTLDVATRLGRYIFQELTGWHSTVSSFIATLATLILPVIFVTKKTTDATGNVIPVWKVFWTLFGSSNQLLAGMVLFGLSVWLYRKKMKYLTTLLPSFLMIIIGLTSLYFILGPLITDIVLKGKFNQGPLLFTGLTLLLLAGLLIIEGARQFKKH